MNKKPILTLAIATLAAGCLAGLASCGSREKGDVYEGGKLVLDLKNLYFEAWSGGDPYLAEIEDRFNVKINPSSYSWADWDSQVNAATNSDDVTDVFHASIDSYNFGSCYKYWAEGDIVKALPDDLSKWPNLKASIEAVSNLESLKLDGKLYGIPVLKNLKSTGTDFSPFTYVYRRDWAKEQGVYKENDEYTWEEFQAVLAAFDSMDPNHRKYALADVEWGFPSITNFYKQAPHCFVEKDGQIVNNYTTDEYIAGLEKSKSFVNNGYYHFAQYSAKDGDVIKEYYGNRAGVYFENLSYGNYATLRKNIKKSNVMDPNFNLDDATAIMKVKGPDGKYALEGTDNWFSMTFFDYRMSQEKQNKILDIMDYLLSEEGTMLATYGIEGYDYEVVGGKIQLLETGWPKNNEGEYVEKNNGAKYLRYMATLGHDILADDPLTDSRALEILNTWESEMNAAKASSTLRVLKENPSVQWMTSPKKTEYAGQMLTNATSAATSYCYGAAEVATTAKFREVVSGGHWSEVLAEINAELRK